MHKSEQAALPRGPDLAAQSRAVGLALLLREGMPGWLRAVAAASGASVAQRTIDAGEPPPAERAAGGGSAPLSGVQRDDVTILLASLVLSTRRLQCSSATEG